jgi:hypothetical protein
MGTDIRHGVDANREAVKESIPNNEFIVPNDRMKPQALMISESEPGIFDRFFAQTPRATSVPRVVLCSRGDRPKTSPWQVDTVQK